MGGASGPLLSTIDRNIMLGIGGFKIPFKGIWDDNTPPSTPKTSPPSISILATADFDPCNGCSNHHRGCRRSCFAPPSVSFGACVFIAGSLPIGSGYAYWLRADQLVRACIFATISKDLLCEVCTLLHSFLIWQHLAHRLNTVSLSHSMDLKHTLTTLSKADNQFLEDYLLKTVVGSLAAIQSPVCDIELIQFTTAGMPPKFNHFITTYSMLLGPHTFDDLCTKLIFYEQRCKFQEDRELVVQHTFVASFTPTSDSGGANNQPNRTIPIIILIKGKDKNRRHNEARATMVTVAIISIKIKIAMLIPPHQLDPHPLRLGVCLQAITIRKGF